MRIVSLKKIKEFTKVYPDASSALHLWYYTVSSKQWNSFNDLKQDYGTADYVGNNRFVFNIKGNHYRIVVIISFPAKKVYLRFIGTHEQYDRINDIKNI